MDASHNSIAAAEDLDCDNRVLTMRVTVVLRMRPELLALSHIVLAINRYLDHDYQWSIVEARECGFEYYIRSRWCNSVEGFSFVDDPHYQLLLRANAMKFAARRGDLGEIKQLAAFIGTNLDYTCGLGIELTQLALEAGALNVLQWLDETGLKSEEWTAEDLALGLEYGHFEIAKWLHDVKGIRLTDIITDYEFSGSAGIEMVNWQRDRDLLDAERAIRLSVRDGRLDVLQWLLQNEAHAFTNTVACSMFVTAAAHGHVNVLLWIGHTFHDIFDDWDNVDRKALNAAAKNGHFEVMEQIYSEHSLRECRPLTDNSSVVIDQVASRGFLDVMQWLHNHRWGSCTTYAMDAAAKFGHLDVLQWLHDNRNEGCTTEAMNGAAFNGHFNVIQWLHEHRQEGCTQKAFEGATKNGHLDIMDWLHTHFPEKCRHDKIRYLTDDCPLVLIEWLCHKGYEIDLRALLPAIRKGRLDVVKWLHYMGHQWVQGSQQGIGPSVCSLAAENGHVHILQWLYSHVSSTAKNVRIAVNAAASKKQFEALLHFHKRDLAISSHHRSKLFSWKTFEHAMESTTIIETYHMIITHWLYTHYQKLVDRNRLRNYEGRHTWSYKWLVKQVR